MSDEQGFLGRWSRRKRAASLDTRSQLPPAELKNSAASTASLAPSPLHESRPTFDPASLPPLETIDAESDIRAFLAAGVPADLTRAALRRAWSADPAIRDFVGLSENSWDFNAPQGVPGFGAMTEEDTRRLAEMMKEPRDDEDAKAPAAEAESPQQDLVPKDSPAVTVPDPALQAGQGGGAESEAVGKQGDAAMQHGAEIEQAPKARRRHGGALPA